MPTPLQGTSGSITWGATNVVWVGEWEYDLENASQTIGPHVGDPTEYEVSTSQKGSWKISGTVPSGGDPGQNLIMAAAAGRTTAALVLEQTLGKVVTFSAANVSKLNVKVAADGSQTFNAEGSNGSGTVTLSQDT